MADKKKDEKPEDGLEEKKSGGINIKLAVPILIVQMIAAYFLASFVIVPMFFGPAQAEAAEEAEEDDSPEFGLIYKVEDVIVNPAESKGAQFLIMNIGLEVKEDGDLSELETKDPKLRDILISTISAKTIDKLDGADDKENLRLEIKKKTSKLLPKNHLKNVYFTNYIIQ